jgi:two-component system phosphate regulon response regulator OmpR
MIDPMNATACAPAPDPEAPQTTRRTSVAGAHILIVDDDSRIRSLLSRFLVAEGYLVSAAADAAEAARWLGDILFDLIVLDVMMPGENGMCFAQRLRAGAEPLRSAPILMLTALAETGNRVSGLEAGADDYLAKPFDPRELSLRIASILRRVRRPAAGPRIAQFDEFSFDFETGELYRREARVPLTTREQEILRILAEREGAIVTRETLAKRGDLPAATERSVDVEIGRLRRKLESDPRTPRLLLTVRGRGYRLLRRAPRYELSPSGEPVQHRGDP